MASQDLATAISCLPRLSKDELLKLKLRIGGHLSVQAPVTPTTTIDTGDYLYDGIVYELKRKGLMRQGATIVVRNIPANYHQDSIEVRELLRSHVGELSAAQRAALGQLAIRALAEFISKYMQVSGTTLMHQIAKVPEALDASYPGYLEAGLLAFCWRKVK